MKSDRGTNLVGASRELEAEFKRVDKTKVANAMRLGKWSWCVQLTHLLHPIKEEFRR